VLSEYVANRVEELTCRLAGALKFFNIAEGVLTLVDGRISFVLQFLDLIVEHTSLSLVLSPLLGQLINIFVLLIDLI
jgi:hypothetical protein